MIKTEKYLEGLTIHKVPYNIANTSDFKTNVMGKAADNELFIVTDTPTFSLKIGSVTYDGTSNVSVTPKDLGLKKLTIGDKEYNGTNDINIIVATNSISGLMSASDKKKLDGIATGATKITVDTSLSSTSTNPVQNKVINSALSGKAGTSVATTNTNGLMSAGDKTKLNGIATGANKTTVDSSLSASSTNPVQNKVIKSALDGKLSTSGGTLTGNLSGQYITGTWLQTTASTDLGRAPEKVAVLDGSGWVYYRTPAEIKSDIGADAVVTTSSDGLMSVADKEKLDGIDTGANKITVDASLSSTSTNPVQNKVINSALGKKLNKSGGTLTGAITTKGIKLTSGTDFGSSLPSSLQSDQLFFQTLGSNYILDNVYPVGSIYMSVNSTNPTNLFGGTWEQIQGRFLFGMNSSYPAGSTGGEITHKLTQGEMPKHNHPIYYPNGGGPDQGAALGFPEVGSKNTWWAVSCLTGAAGDNEAHNNMPPYLSVYIWKRTA